MVFLTMIGNAVFTKLGACTPSGLLSSHAINIVLGMGSPTGPVTLTIEQIDELNKKLSTLRHDINGDLALVVASAELAKLNPASAPQRLKMLLEQPEKIRRKMDEFSAEFEKVLGIVR